MNLRSGRISAIAAAVMAIGTLSGIAGTVPASAASWTNLCSPTDQGESYACLDANGVGKSLFYDDNDPAVHTTNWTYPNVDDAVGAIRQANVSLCAQIDATAGDLIKGAACNGDLAEKWQNIYNAGSKRTEFISVWAINNKKGALCLSLAEAGVYALPCGQPDQQFAS